MTHMIMTDCSSESVKKSLHCFGNLDSWITYLSKQVVLKMYVATT